MLDPWCGLLPQGYYPYFPKVISLFLQRRKLRPRDFNREVKNHLPKIRLQCRRPQFNSWVRKICWRRDRLPIPVSLGFPCGSAGKESAGDLSSVLGWEDPLEKGKATHSSILSWRIPWTIVHGVTKSWSWLSDFHFSLQDHISSQTDTFFCTRLLCPWDFPG